MNNRNLWIGAGIIALLLLFYWYWKKKEAVKMPETGATAMGGTVAAPVVATPPAAPKTSPVVPKTTTGTSGAVPVVPAQDYVGTVSEIKGSTVGSDFPVFGVE
jgi:hypothetical protein